MLLVANFVKDLTSDSGGKIDTAIENINKLANAIQTLVGVLQGIGWVAGKAHDVMSVMPDAWLANTLNQSSKDYFDPMQFGKGLTTQGGGYGMHAFADEGIVTGPVNALVGEAGEEAILPLDCFNDFAEFMRQLGEQVGNLSDAISNSQGGFNMGSGGYGNGNGFGLGSGYDGSTGPIRVEGYGPAYGEFGQVTGNHGNRLRMGDYAISPDLARGHRPGDTFTFTDSHGNVHHGRYSDASYCPLRCQSETFARNRQTERARATARAF